MGCPLISLNDIIKYVFLNGYLTFWPSSFLSTTGRVYATGRNSQLYRIRLITKDHS